MMIEKKVYSYITKFPAEFVERIESFFTKKGATSSRTEELKAGSLELKREQRKGIDSLFSEYTPEQKEIIHRAYLFYTDKYLEGENYGQIKEPGRVKKRYIDARNIIKELFDEESMLEEGETQNIFDKIDTAIKRKVQTRGSISKKFTKKMNNELDRLQATQYKQKEIIKRFHILRKVLIDKFPSKVL